MDKEFNKTLSQVPMFSKMGKYISSKILKYNRSESRKVRRPPTPPYDYLSKTRKQGSSVGKKDTNCSLHTPGNAPAGSPVNSPALNESSHCKHLSSSQSASQLARQQSKMASSATQFRPPVGYYKVNYKQIEKNSHIYNFKRSVPHFHNDKYVCHEITGHHKIIPDNIQQKIKGFKELGRMAGRPDIKGCERKFLEDPHQNRFIIYQDGREIQNRQCRVDLRKTLGRDEIVYNGAGGMLKNAGMSSPDYQCNFELGKKRLDTHILPFEKYSERTEKYFQAPTGISNTFNSDEKDVHYNCNPSHSSETVFSWKKALPRQKTGVVPSYMDKTVNSRMALGGLNLKSLQMNCSSLRNSANEALLTKSISGNFMKSKGKRYRERFGESAYSCNNTLSGKENASNTLQI